MDSKLFYIIFAITFTVANGFSVKDILEYLLGGGNYGQYPNYPSQYPANYPGNPGNYPGNPGNPGNYPSNPGNQGLYPSGPGYPGQYPGSGYPSQNPGVVGPPGAHPGCPLCDSSVYSYCSHKQAHDACCCDNPAYLPFSCRKSDCKYLYANSCSEYQLISNCCCVDLHKNAVAPLAV